MSKIFNWSSLFLIILSIITSIIYVIFNNYFIINIIIIALLVLSLYLFIFKKRIDWLIIVNLFLVGFIAYHSLTMGLICLWQAMIIIIITTGILNQLLFQPKIQLVNNLLFYNFLILLIYTEIFLALAFWPINANSKSVILLAILFFIWNIFHIKLENKLNKKNILPFVIITIVIITGVICSVDWISY